MKARRVAWLAFAAVMSGACTDGSDETAASCRTFSTSLSIKDRMSQATNVFNPNEPITFELSITNTLNTLATLTASSPCAAVVFEVTDSAQQRRWGSADGIACIQMLQPYTYAALEVVNESAAWDQRDSNGALVPSGTYEVTASVGQYVPATGGLVDCRGPLGKSATFTIQ